MFNPDRSDFPDLRLDDFEYRIDHKIKEEVEVLFSKGLSNAQVLKYAQMREKELRRIKNF